MHSFGLIPSVRKGAVRGRDGSPAGPGSRSRAGGAKTEPLRFPLEGEIRDKGLVRPLCVQDNQIRTLARS